MFRLSSHELTGRRILIIEDDEQTAVLLATAVRAAGGTVIGHVSTVDEALDFIVEQPADQALVHIRYTSQTTEVIPEAFARRGTEAVFLACHDEWFDIDDDVDGPPRRMAM